MINGSCLCGLVTYQYEGDITELAMCHCSQCRKAQGGAFATNSPVDAAKLVFTGSEHIKEYASNSDKVRAFCKNCGSPLYSALKSVPEIKRLRLGTVDTAFTCNNKYHIYAESIASWHEITDTHTQHSNSKPAE